MDNEKISVTLEIGSNQEIDKRELMDLTEALQSEINALPIETIDILKKEGKKGEKTGTEIIWGSLIITLAPVIIGNFTKLLIAWIDRHKNKTIKMRTEKGEFIFKGNLSKDEKEMLTQFIKTHQKE